MKHFIRGVQNKATDMVTGISVEDIAPQRYGKIVCAVPYVVNYSRLFIPNQVISMRCSNLDNVVKLLSVGLCTVKLAGEEDARMIDFGTDIVEEGFTNQSHETEEWRPAHAASITLSENC